MVIEKITDIFEKRKQNKEDKLNEKKQLESFKESESLQRAEQIKKEADRLAHLKQYKTSIEEYKTSLEICPYNKKEAIFQKQAKLFFNIFYGIAASYLFLNKFNDSIEYFDKALEIEKTEDENKVKALMSKGSCYYTAKQFLSEEYAENLHKIRLESEFEMDKKNLEIFKKLDEKENLLKLAHSCFTKATELDKHDADTWYKKGHMEFLMGQVKEAMFSFDNLLEVQTNYENKEEIGLFDDIKREKGIEIKSSKVLDDDFKFKTKTGHLVTNKAEKMVANFLFDNDIVFQYNLAVAWADKDDFKATFFIPKLDLYLEHFKYDHIKDYQKLMRWKIKQYKKNKKKLVYTISKDEKNIEDSLKIKLKEHIVL